jgi:hypothetical protein
MTVPTAVMRPLSRFAALGAAAVALAAVRIPGRPHTLCVFRAVTGLPCPLCGGTTAAVRVGQGRLLAAFAANPVVILGAAVLVLVSTEYGRRAVRSWRALPPRSRLLLGSAVLVLSEGWQLVRFGFM